MRRAASLSILTVALLLIIAAPAVAKDGFYLGINILFNDVGGVVNTPANIEPGYGHGLHAGYGINQYLAIEAGIWRTRHTKPEGGRAADIEAGTLDLKINIPLADSHIEPYFVIGAGHYTIDQNGISEDGKGGRIGIGLDIYLFPDISFNIGFIRNSVTFSQNSVDMEGKITTMDFGVTYHFM